MTDPTAGRAWRRGVALGVAVLLTATAAVAIAVLLAGRTGTVEGRILATTAVLAGYGVLALPASMLLDLGRARPLAVAVLGLDAGAAALAVTAIWTGGDPERLQRGVWVAAVAAVAAAQIAALTARRRATDARLIRGLFVVSTALAVIVAVLVGGMIWQDAGPEPLARIAGALAVLDLLAAALQPVLARARPASVAVRMRVRLSAGPPAEVTAEGRDLAAAVAEGIRRAERGGAAAVGVDVIDHRAA